MTNKTIEDLIKNKNDVCIKRDKFQEEINKIKKTKKEVKKKLAPLLKEYISNYQELIKELNEQKNQYDNDINTLTRFPSDILYPFLIDCINLYEDEEYVYRKILLNYGSYTYEGALPQFVATDLIFPKSLLEEETKIEQTFFVSSMPISYKGFFDSQASKYIMKYNYYEEQMIVNDRLNSIFINFPYLEEIIFNIANRRLRETDKKLPEILNDELEDLRKNQNVQKTKD